MSVPLFIFQLCQPIEFSTFFLTTDDLVSDHYIQFLQIYTVGPPPPKSITFTYFKNSVKNQIVMKFGIHVDEILIYILSMQIGAQYIHHRPQHTLLVWSTIFKMPRL